MTLRYSRWPVTVETRFWLKVWPRGDCWEWRGYIDTHGYGKFNLYDEIVPAHRVAFQQAKGVIPLHMELDHLCRHRWCVKPSHLECVTPRTNCLRGESRAAQFARSSSCIHGHPWDATNTYVHTNGRRMCRTCRRERMRVYLARDGQWRDRQ